MVIDLLLLDEGTCEGIIITFDMKGVVLGHLLRMGLFTVKHFMHYLQEGMPVRIRGLQFFNIVPFVDKILLLVKPFMKKSLFEMLQLHTTIDPVYEHIPPKMFPRDYTEGSAPSIEDLNGRWLSFRQWTFGRFIKEWLITFEKLFKFYYYY